MAVSSKPRDAAEQQPPADVPVLTAARLVCRECLASRGVGTLEHVVRRVDAFLDTFSGPGAVTNACKHGAPVRALTYLAARDLESLWKEAASFAATCGHVHVLQWLSEFHPDRCDWGSAVMNGAALCGHLPVVQWLHENRSEGCTVHAMDSAARNNDLSMVQWLHDNRSEGCTRGAMDWAAAADNLEMVRWLHDNRNEGCSIRAMDWAAAEGHLEMVQWLLGHRIEGDAGRALRAAARAGQLAVVQWLHAARGGSQSDDMDSRAAFDMASVYGYSNVAEWLQAHRNGSRYMQEESNPTDETAATHPHLERAQRHSHLSFHWGNPIRCILDWLQRGGGD